MEDTATEPLIRGWIQYFSMWDGVIMQKLGELLLEIGCAIVLLSMGQYHAEVVVNYGSTTEF